MSGGEQEADAFGRLSLRPQWRRAGAGSTWHACQRKAAPAAPAGDRPGAAAAAATAGSAAAPAQPAAPTIGLASAAAPAVPEPAVCQEKQAAAAPLEEWEVLWSGEGDEPAIPLPFGMPHPAPEAAQQLAAIAPAGLQSQLQQRQQQQQQQQLGQARHPPEAKHAQHGTAGHHASSRSTRTAPAPMFVPIKEWRSCEQIAAGMEALPAGRLDQRLLSAAMQQMVAVRGGGGKRPGDAACFQRLLALALPRLGSFDAFGLCIVVRSAARLGAKLKGAELQAWSEAAERRMDSFNPQDLANSLYSIGLLGQRLGPPVRASFCAAVRQRCRHMKPQEQANTLLGLAYQFGERHRDQAPPGEVEEAAVAVLQAAERSLQAMLHQELANTAWAFSKLATRRASEACSSQLHALFSEVADRAASLPPQELSNLLLAQANLAFFHPGALAALAAAAARRAARLEEQHLDNILLSIAHLPHHLPAADHQPDRPSTAAGGRRQLQRCVDLADVATLQQELLHRLGTVGQPLARYTPTCQAICRGVWALAVLQCCTIELWHAALAALEEWQEAGSTDFQEGYAQLHIAQLLLAAEGLPAALPAALQQRAQHAVRSIWEEATESKLHRQVSAALRATGMEHCVEFTPEGGHHSVDLALPEEHIAIEVDGPHHFTVNEVGGRHWPLGHTAARDRLLRHQGWQVVAVDCWSWRHLATAEERQAWLAEQLAAARRNSLAGRECKQADAQRQA